MITDIIFDFFGTLVHYTPSAFHSAPYSQTHQFLLQHGFPIGYDAFVDAFTAASDALEATAQQTLHEYHMDAVGRAFFHDAFGRTVDEAVLQPFIACFINEWSRGIVYLDGIAAFLDQLAPFYRLSVLSNTHYPALIHTNLAAMNIAKRFATVVTSVEVGMRKPHAAVFQHALAELGIAPHQALYVGDTYLDDYVGATGAGMQCVLIDPAQRHREVPHRIDHLFDLVPPHAALRQETSV